MSEELRAEVQAWVGEHLPGTEAGPESAAGAAEARAEAEPAATGGP
ncbi:hypothetical protein H7H37_26495 [Mycolicibacterium insubricum]|nr:hypothetical protein [Mycolicibacterium insubricum]